MKEPVLSILIPATRHEVACLPTTLWSVQKEILRLNKPCEIIVIANCCKGTADEVAKKVLATTAFQSGLITAQVINCETLGKMSAVNDGITASHGSSLLVLDSDVIFDAGSFAWTLDALEMPGVKVVSVHHAPIESALPKDEMLTSVIRMNAYRRHTFPEKYWLHGAYMGWKASLEVDGKPLRFPAGKRVPDDNWLTAVVARDHGFKAMRVTKNYMVRFIPPQSWDDYYQQQWRYQFAHEDLAAAFPDLAEYIPMIRKWTHEKYPEDWIDMEWRETCIKNNIDFDKVISYYDEVLQKVRDGKEAARQLLDENGVWKQQTTTKYNPNGAR